MANQADTAKGAASEAGKVRRKIQGNLPYITNHGRIRPVLEKIISAAKPDRLSQDYLDKIFGLPAGTYKTVLPILRRVGLIGADGSPTELYNKFRSDDTRALAAFSALKNGFPDLFKRSEHVYAAPDAKLADTIAEATGLAKGDPTVGAIRGTFRAFSSYLPEGFSSAQAEAQSPLVAAEPIRPETSGAPMSRAETGQFPTGLSYHINIVLPETKDAEVYNLIFKSLRENLLRE
ncbi:MAG: DUF5343 domain-containing protein [Caulobacter sp.]|nr:DUF5343 domain-containing protein [Caulobacter sp.]